MRMLIATMNEGKLREYQRLLGEVPGLQLETMASLPSPVDVVEDRDTFEGNARKKAREIADAAGVTCLARPGVYSARYSGDGATDASNNEKLLDELGDVPAAERTARFRCVIVVVDAEGRELALADGSCEGRIAHAPPGTHGFGYDPPFIPAGYAQTMAELGPETKNQISHRAKAAAKLVPILRELRIP